jgi:predicted DCC family thiol-disulfide oxidoreductase YuxK
MERDPNQWLVLYDRDCGFCRWSLGRVLALDRDRRLRPVALGTPEADPLLSDLSTEQRADSWHLVSPGGERASAGAAAPELLRLLRGGRIPAAVFASAPRLTERGYQWIASHRASLSRAIPSSAERRADALIARREQQRS